MADDRFDTRPSNFLESLPWTELFRTFRVALDPKKLLLAAAGILVMACGWWVISVAFYNAWSMPLKKNYQAPSTPHLKLEYSDKDDDFVNAKYKELQDVQDREY